jgi:HAMP domain-containing protein
VHLAIAVEGDFEQRVNLPAPGAWGRCVDSANQLIDNMVQPMILVRDAIGAVADGDLSCALTLINNQPQVRATLRTPCCSLAVPVWECRGIFNLNNLTQPTRALLFYFFACFSVQLQGEYRHTSQSLTQMIRMLNSFNEEVLRVVCDVGIEGKLGGQAEAVDLRGIWKDLTDNVNTMAANLTGQVRAVAQVTTAVARGDLSKKMTAEAKGEILELKNTINTMVDQLNAFASEVTRVAREVGTEGKLGGQAQVTGVPISHHIFTLSVVCAVRDSHESLRRNRGYVEGPHGQRQHHGGQPHRSGARHCPRHYCSRQRRPFQEDHC